MQERMLEKARKANSAEELLTMAKAEGMELTQEQAEEYFAKLSAQHTGELADDELDAVAGGGCSNDKLTGKFKVGDHVLKKGNFICNQEYSYYKGAQPVRKICHSTYWVVTGTKAGRYCIQCPQCGVTSDYYAEDGLWSAD